MTILWEETVFSTKAASEDLAEAPENDAQKRSVAIVNVSTEIIGVSLLAVMMSLMLHRRPRRRGAGSGVGFLDIFCKCLLAHKFTLQNAFIFLCIFIFWLNFNLFFIYKMTVFNLFQKYTKILTYSHNIKMLTYTLFHLKNDRLVD